MPLSSQFDFTAAIRAFYSFRFLLSKNPVKKSIVDFK